MTETENEWRKLLRYIVWSVRSFILDLMVSIRLMLGHIFFSFFFKILKKSQFFFVYFTDIVETTEQGRNYTYMILRTYMKRIFRDATYKHTWNPREIQNGFLHKKRKFLVEDQMCIRRRKFLVFGLTFLLFATKMGMKIGVLFFFYKKLSEIFKIMLFKNGCSAVLVFKKIKLL